MSRRSLFTLLANYSGVVKISGGNARSSHDDKDCSSGPPEKGPRDAHGMLRIFRFSRCELINGIVEHITTVTKFSSNKEGNCKHMHFSTCRRLNYESVTRLFYCLDGFCLKLFQ